MIALESGQSYFVAFFSSAIAAPLIMRLLVRARSRQSISEYVPEHSAKQGTPTMGGLIVLAGVFAGSLLAGGEGLVAPLLLLLGFGLIGFVDDYVVPRLSTGKRGLGWVPKLILQVAAAVAALTLGGWSEPWAVGIAVFLVLFASNAYNFADGMDGLAGSLGIILAAALVTFLRNGNALNDGLRIALLTLSGALVPFLFLNAPPAKVFMGDVGALPIGALLGYGFAVVAWNGGDWGSGYPGATQAMMLLALLALGLVLILELVPVPLQILSVKLRKGKRLFPRTPIHHAFQHAGWPETRVVAMFVLAQLVLVAASWALYPWNETAR